MLIQFLFVYYIIKTFKLQSQINKQKKKLILNINNIKKFDYFRIRFQHLIDSDYFLFNLFSCNEFVRSRRHELDRLMKRIKQESLIRKLITYLKIIF